MADWLETESELQISLVSSSCSKEHTLQLFQEQSSCYVAVDTISTCHTSISRPQVAAKVLDRQSGTCESRDQGAKGIPLFGSDKQQIILFIARSAEFSEVGFLFSIFDQKEHVGIASLLPKHFLSCDCTKGSSCLTVFSPDLRPIGTLLVTHLLVNPVKGLNSKRDFARKEWKREKATLEIGHRGLGDSYCDDKSRNPPVTENTIESLRQAGECGADLVEFDVQLTRDLVPVVFHDFRVCASLESGGGDGVGLCRGKVLVKDLSLKEIRDLKLEHTSVVKSKSSDGCLELGVEVVERLECKEAEEVDGGVAEDAKPFPTLEELFLKIPFDVGFNIEVKYPVPELDNGKYSFPYFDLNKMADRILKVVFKHSEQGRRIIFSCFNADMCTVLRLKQPHYQVIFLTTNNCPQWKDHYPVDMRSRQIQDALMHAQAQNLQGINIDSYQLLSEPHWVGVVKEERGLSLYTWGRENSLENIEKQRDLGVDGVIYDRIDEVLGSSEKEEVANREM